MSDEKKTHTPHNGKQHRRGYFIQPPTEAAKTAPSRPNTESNSAHPTPPTEGGAKQHHHKPHRQSPHKSHSEQSTSDKSRLTEMKNTVSESAPETKADAQTIKNDSSTAVANTHKKKNNRNKKRRKSKRPTDAQQMPPAKELEPTALGSAKEKTVVRPFMREARAPVHSDEYEEYKLCPDDGGDVVNDVSEAAPEEDSTPKTEVVGIRFKSSGKTYYFAPNGATYKKGTYAIVDTARGQEYGEVSLTNTLVKSSSVVPPLREVVRAATPADTEHHKENKVREEEAFKICAQKIAAHKLDMKLIEAQYTFDNSKLLFYFTAADRVDFRELVKDLAGVFRTRIELRQIGIRDEAKLMGGLGICGRPLCCKLFLSDFDQVSIKMAKEQNLSLNSAKISGICGRLMCCLKYEHEAYEYEIKRTPPVDSLVRTENGDGIVTETNPLRGLIKVRLLASPEQLPKYYHRDNVTMLRKKQGEDKK